MYLEECVENNENAKPEEPGMATDEETPSPKAEFIRELEKLFALLLLSPRKYVDPSAVAELLRAQSPALRGPSLLPHNNQEDVNEVTHALLALVEGASRELPPASLAGPNRSDSPALPSITDDADDAGPGGAAGFEPKSVVEELFFTAADKRILAGPAGGQGDGEAAWSLETHLLLPVEVGGVEAIEDGLEAALCSEIEGGAGRVSETWLVRPPPVLLLDLKRFTYSRERAAAEKLHSRLAFPTTLYLDRFLPICILTKHRRQHLQNFEGT